MTSRLTPVVLRTQLAGMLRRPGRLILTGLSVLVASFVVFSTVMAYQITTRTTLDTFSGTSAATGLVVEAESGTTISAAALTKIRGTAGVAEAVARADDLMRLGESDSSYLKVTADPGAGPLARVHIVDGRYPIGQGELAVDRPTAERLALTPGGRVTVRPQGDDKARPVTATVTGIVEGPRGRDNQAYAPDGTVAALTGQKGFTRIDVRLDAGATKDAVVAALLPVVNPTDAAVASIRDGDIVRTAEARAAAGQFDEVFALIAMFVAIAVVAAALVATSTFRIVFAQRLRQLALLRAIGAHRRQLTRALSVEGAVTGLVAGSVGVLLALAAGLVVPAAVKAYGVTLSAPGVPVAAGLAVILGAVLVTVGAVLAPALSAAGVAPLQALRSASTNSGQRGIGFVRAFAGSVLLAGALLIAGLVYANLPEPTAAATYSPAGGLFAVVTSGTLAFGALIALGPLLIRPVLAAIGWPLRRLGPTGALAVGGIGGAPRRASAVSVVVALGVTLVAGTLVGTACLQAYVDRGLAVQSPADFALTADGRGLPDDLVARLAARPALADVTPFRSVSVTVDADGSGALVADLDLGALPALEALTVTSGSLGDLGPGRVILSGSVADRNGLRSGDRMSVTGASGPVTFTVAATLPDSAPMGAGIIAVPADLTALGAPAPPTGVLANASATGKAGLDAGEAALRAAVGSNDRVDVVVLAEQRDDTKEDISALFVIALGMLCLTVLIAVVGVGTTTALSVLERTQESELLRALGLGRLGLLAMLTAESGLYGVVGAALGMALGIPYAWLSIVVLNLNAPLRLPVVELLVLFVALAAITALAGLLPARRAARVSPVVALGTVA